MRHKLAVALVFLGISSAIGQTSSEFEKSYGKPVISYMGSEHILMTPEFTTDGQVCKMRLHPRHFSPVTNYVSPSLPFEELTRVLNNLVPPRSRGAKKEPFDTGAAGEGGEWMFYKYENVEFYFVSSFRPDLDSWKTRKEYVFTVEPDPAPAQLKPKDTVPSDNDFSSSEVSIIETVTIRWHGRQCAKQ